MLWITRSGTCTCVSVIQSTFLLLTATIVIAETPLVQPALGIQKTRKALWADFELDSPSMAASMASVMDDQALELAQGSTDTSVLRFHGTGAADANLIHASIHSRKLLETVQTCTLRMMFLPSFIPRACRDVEWLIHEHRCQLEQPDVCRA